MKKIILGFILGGIVFTLGGVVASTLISSKNVTYQNKTVNNALDELYSEAVTGQELVAAAITNKGVTTTSSDTYEVMANNINSIDNNHTEINQKINNLESKHNSDVASLTGSISNLNKSLTELTSILLFKEVTGISGTDGNDGKTIPFPEGFNKDNTFVIGINSLWTNGSYLTTGYQTSVNQYTLYALINADGIVIRGDGSAGGKTVKVLIARLKN